MHAPLRRFFERLSNSSNNGGASLPYIRNKRNHDNKKENIVKDGRWGRLGEEIPRQYHKNRMAMQKNEKRKAKTGIMLVSQACGREPQKQENGKNVHTRKWACMSKEDIQQDETALFWLVPFLSLFL